MVIGHTVEADFAILNLDEEEFVCEVREISDFNMFTRKGGICEG